MITCESCQIGYPIGALYCLKCGQSLFDLTTVSQVRRVSGDIRPSGAGQIRLYLPTSRRSIELHPAPQVTLGRIDTTTGVVPDVDLTADNGQQAGVSRQHAAIRQQEDRFWLIDLNSVNGTFHNGTKILPTEPVPLANGDEIRLAGFVLRVYI